MNKREETWEEQTTWRKKVRLSAVLSTGISSAKLYCNRDYCYFDGMAPHSAVEQVTFKNITEREFFKELVFSGGIGMFLSVETTTKTAWKDIKHIFCFDEVLMLLGQSVVHVTSLPISAPESPCDSSMGMKGAFLIWEQGKRGNTFGFAALDSRCLGAVY
jgi:hypothetical protein